MSVETKVLANLPPGRYPANYEAARASLATCTKLDECKQWADKAEALASYAKQAQDVELRRMADRIQMRAIDRMGELLKAITEGHAGRPAIASTSTNGKLGGPLPPISRAQAARDAHISRDQKRTALRVASVPRATFEALVESENPPTVTAMAKLGTRAAPKPLVDLKGRDPREFALATRAQGIVEELVRYVDGQPDLPATDRPEGSARGVDVRGGGGDRTGAARRGRTVCGMWHASGGHPPVGEDRPVVL